MKKNDYLIASINNPEFDAEDFKNIAGYSLEDTQMLKEEDYLGSDFIKSNPLFLDSNGVFSKELFSDYYKEKLKDFGNFSNENFADTYQYSAFDTRRKGKDPVSPFGLTFFNNPNPTMLSIGIEGPNILGERLLSDREIAQGQKIFDTATGQFLDFTPNDSAFFKNPFKWAKSLIDDPLVLAIYDNSGTHQDPITKLQVKHRKGLLKLNNEGLPYYERLNGRSLVGRDILSATDILTIDGSVINKYDFMDSDDLDKSIGGVIMKTVAALAPLFIGPIAPYYGTYLMFRELAKTAPMLYAMGTALFNDKTDHPISNTIAAYADKITTSTSDYAKLHTFSAENFGNLIADVALQWELLMAVVRAFQKLNNATNKRIEVARIKALADYENEATKLINSAKLGSISLARAKELTGASSLKELKDIISTNKWQATLYGRTAQERHIKAIEDYIANRTRLGQDLSLGYMALISNTDVYSSALEHGADKKEAAALALGSTAGMFTVDKFLGLGEMFFQVAPERQIFRSTLKHEVELAIEKLIGKSKELPNIKGFFNTGVKSAKKVVTNFREAAKSRELPILGKAIGEGLEEVSEELVTDLVKSAGELAADFGWISGPTNLGAWDNLGDRYIMSLLGGTIGGGIFGVRQKLLGIENQSGPKALDLLVRQGRTTELRKELKNMHKKGLLGRTDLSIVYEEDKDGNKIFLTPDEKNISQNDFMYNTISQAIDLILSIIEGDHLGKTENDLFEQLVLKDERYLRLKSFLLDKSYLTGYQERYQRLVESIIENERTISKFKDSELAKDKSEVETAKANRNEKLLERDKFLSGELSLDYLRKLNFIMNPAVSRGFINLSLEDFARSVTGTDYHSLDRIQQWEIYTRHQNYLASRKDIKADVDKAYDSFKDLTAKLGQPIVNYILNYTPSYQAWDENIKILEDAKLGAAWDWDTQLQGEGEEDYKARNSMLEGETPEDFITRQVNRQNIIVQHNEQVMNYLREALRLGALIDETNKRRLSILLLNTELQIKKLLLRSEGITDPEIGKEIMDGTPPEEVLPKLRKKKEQEIRSTVWGTLVSPEFSMVEVASEFSPEGEVKGYESIPAEIELKNAEYTDEQKVMLVAQQRMMDKLGIRNYNVPNLYNALGTTPQEVQTKFYEIYNEILQEIIQEDLELGKYPGLTFTGNVRAVNHPIADLLVKYGEGLEAITATDPDERKKAISSLANNFTLYDIREQAISELIANELDEWEKNGIIEQAGNITRALEDNQDLKLLKELKGHSVLQSPGLAMLEIVNKLIEGEIDINALLKELGLRFDALKEEGEFEITDIEKNNLSKAKERIEVAKSIIASMYRSSYLGDSVSYNKSINEFVKAHKETQENWEDLPVIDNGIGQSIYHSLEMFTLEIDEWIALADRNSDNKVKNIEKAAAAYNGVKHNVLFGTLKGHTVLKDFEGESDIAAEVTAFYNALKEIQNGKSIDTLLDEYLSLLGKNDAVTSLVTSEINLGLADSTFTAYDRFMYMATISAINKAEYLKAEKEFFKKNPGVAYLPTLEPALLYAYALKHNPEFIYKAIDKIRTLASKKGLDMPPIYGLIVTGIGGAGKTTATAAFFAKDEDSIWLSGPDLELITGLKKIAPNGEGKLRKDLINYILGGNRKLLEQHVAKTGLDGSTTLILSDISSKLVTKDAPKYLIIDEATHYSNLELQAISLWAKKGGTKVLYIGDENQMGNSIVHNRSYISNFLREVSIAFRAPRLAISLRTSNKWKTDNQNELVFLMNKLRNADLEESTRNAVNEVLSYFEHDFKLKYWENDLDLHGDKIVKSLSDIDFSKLTGKKIAYIGKNYSEIAGKVGNVEAFDSIEKVQGKEFDYVISDNVQTKFDTKQAPTLLEGLRTFYTVVSRSKIGGILVDGENAYNFIHSQKLTYTTQSINLSEDVIKGINVNRFAFIDLELANVPSFNDELNEEEESSEEEPRTPKVDKKRLSNEENPEPEFNGEYRAYSNINFLGGVTLEDVTINVDVFGPGKYTVWHASGDRKDIGIFAKDGVLAKTPQEKAALVYDLACLRSLFTFNKLSDDNGQEYLDVSEFNNLPLRVQDLFDLDSFEKVQYFAVAEDYNETSHRLIGLTTADDKKVSFMKGKDGKDKVISIQARIPGKNGVIYTITLGAVANPDKWEQNLADRVAPEDPVEAKAFLEDIDNQTKAIAQYRLDLENLVNEDKEIEINKPAFSGQTEIVPLDDKIALADIEGGISEWEKRTANFSISPVYVIVLDLKEINPELSSLLKGKPVVFVSSDPTLDKHRLRDMWKNLLLHKDSSTATVRMLVLDNRGISFNSLYNHTFDDIYTTTFLNKEGEEVYFKVPVETEPEAVRIFINTWNFRANLLNFDTKVQELMDQEKWDIDTLEEKVTRYNELYQLAKAELTNDESTSRSLSDPLFLKWLQEHPDLDGVEDTLKIRDFNQNLNTREFRLGYSKDGAYISRILGEGVKLYPDSNDAYGIYITPKLAKQYIKVLDNYFNAIVNPIFKDTVAALSVKENDKEVSLVNKNIELTEEKWYDTLQNKRLVSLGIEGVGVKKVSMPIAEDLNSFTFAVINIPSLLKRKAVKGKNLFMSEYNKAPKEGKEPLHRVKIKVNGIDLYAEYTEIDEAFEFNGTKGILPIATEPRENLTGEILVDWEREDGVVLTRYIDTRLDTFFSLMFHGIVALKVYNNFEESNLIAASDADFRHGIFIDATLAPFEGSRKVGNIASESKNFAAETNSHNALFLTDSLPAGPLLSFSFEKKTKEIKSVDKKESKKIIEKTTNPYEELINRINTIAGKKFLNPDKTYTEKKIEKKINELNSSLFNSAERFDLNNILFNLGQESLFDRYSEKYPDLANIVSKEKKEDYILLTTETAMYTVKKEGNDFIIKLYTVSDEAIQGEEKSKDNENGGSSAAKPGKPDAMQKLTMGKLRTFITNYFANEDSDDLEEIKNYMSRWTPNKVITADYNQLKAALALIDSFPDRDSSEDSKDNLFITFEQALSAFFNCR